MIHHSSLLTTTAIAMIHHSSLLTSTAIAMIHHSSLLTSTAAAMIHHSSLLTSTATAMIHHSPTDFTDFFWHCPFSIFTFSNLRSSKTCTPCQGDLVSRIIS